MKEIVVMGAGPAGLTFSYTMLKENKDCKITIIEKNKSVGGISKTIKYKGNCMDLGGHRFFTKSKEVNVIWKELLKVQGKKAYDDKVLKRDARLERGGLDPEKEDNVFLIRRRLSRIYFNKHLIDYPVSLNMDTLKAIGFKESVKSCLSYIKSSIFKRREDNLEDFYINRFGKRLYEMFFKDYTAKVWGRYPDKISADWGRQRVKGLSIRKILKNMLSTKFHIKEKNKETSLIEYFYYPKYGPGQMWNLMEEKVKEMGADIIKDAEVESIELKENKVKSISYVKGGKTYKIDADIFVSTLSIKDLINMMHIKNKKILSIANNLPYRDFITIGLVLDNINLKTDGTKTFNNITPDTWIYVQDKDIKMGRIQIFNNWSPYLVKDIKKTVSVGLEYFASKGDSFWNMKDKDIINFGIDELIKMNIIDNKKDVISSHIERVEKAYPAYFDSYKEFDKLKTFLDKIDNLYLIGRNGQHRYNNMDHSMLTGIRCKDCILGKASREDIWNVNAEKEYLEEKNEKNN